MTTTNAQLFAQAGKQLFGDNWQQNMARALNWPIDERGQNRTVQRIKAAADAGEEYRIAPGVLTEIAGLMEVRSAQSKAMAKTLRAAAAKASPVQPKP
ncbi:hypothetical protein KOAAANKH_02551 [Brevundimonas sp. NIBR10]|uniref:hypothetical protein n=1 Tax=Brevundimonas sp. NIBR10 TaxID=3015997 RepID=UPI0022F1AE27|nr:hypothetical protein [Brevundimonas sp. NIBR10]WGM47669.1 hypothetical protein KOAAANKH_02551 [Brevundimonas sp. NIBR10]